MTEYMSLSLSVQSLIRWGFALCTLGTLLFSMTGFKRFFGTEKHGGYADDGPLLNVLLSPLGRVVVVASWVASACWLCMDRHTVLASLVCLVWSRFFFLALRWKSISRGMGAPGFMLYWLAALVFFLEYTRFYDPSGILRMVVILAFKVDFAVIMLCSGQYKLFSGYPQNNGMERGMANPWWGRFCNFYKKLPPHSILFKFLNQCAYLGELVAGTLMLWPACAEFGGLFMAGSFVFILANIKLGFLCHTVIVCCLLYSAPGGWLDSLLPAVQEVPALSHTVLNIFDAALVFFFVVYILLLPFAKAGLYYNFYGKKRLPGAWQDVQDRWCNLFGIIIWRVFTIDNTNFFVRSYFENRETGERTEYSRPMEWDAGTGFRYIFVCEFVCFVSIFTTLKYFPSNSPLFLKKLWRYAKTIPCPDGSDLIFEWVDLKKTPSCFEHVASKEFRINYETQEITAVDLADGSSETDSLRFSDLHEGAKVGSYAPSK